MALTAAERLRDWILTEPMTFTTEADLQQAIWDRLTAMAADPADLSPIDETTLNREVRLDARNRIDFLIDVYPEDGWKVCVGVEVKIKSALAEVIRQLQRYATFDAIDELLLVTTKASHHHVPDYIGGKRVVLCSLVERGL